MPAKKKAPSKTVAKTKAKPTKKSVAQSDFIWTVIVALLLGVVVGYVLSAVMDDDEGTEQTTAMDEMSTRSEHELFEVDPEVDFVPSIQVLADADEKSGWNLTLLTDNFIFTPTDVNEADELGTGHAHIYVDGEKIGRVYSNFYHLGELGAGEHEIRITINTNTHKDYAVDGVVISDTIVVTETDDGGSSVHMHDDGEEHEHSN